VGDAFLKWVLTNWKNKQATKRKRRAITKKGSSALTLSAHLTLALPRRDALSWILIRHSPQTRSVQRPQTRAQGERDCPHSEEV
jgi:hypothetical protein